MIARHSLNSKAPVSLTSRCAYKTAPGRRTPAKPSGGCKSYSRRRLDRCGHAADRVIAAKKTGAIPCGGSLSHGPLVPADIALNLINCLCVVLVGDALFPNTPAQTWRFVEPKGDPR